MFNQARLAGLAGYYLEDLEEDHRRFAEILADPERLDDAGLESFFAELHHHIAIEEYDVFPAVARVLTRDQWASIDALDTQSPS